MPGGAATEVGPTLAIPRSTGTYSSSPSKGPVVRPILVRSLTDTTESSSLGFTLRRFSPGNVELLHSLA